MALKYSTGLRNFLVGEGSLRKAFEDGALNIYSGAAPANADDAPTGVLLARITKASGVLGSGARSTPKRYKVVIGSHAEGHTFPFALTVDGVGPVTITHTNTPDAGDADAVAKAIAQMLSDIPQLRTIAQRLVDNAIEKPKTQGEVDPGTANLIRLNFLETLADDLKARGAGRFAIKGAGNIIEGYQKTNLKEVLKDYIDGWSGMITKQEAALAFSLHSTFLSKNPFFSTILAYSELNLWIAHWQKPLKSERKLRTRLWHVRCSIKPDKNKGGYYDQRYKDAEVGYSSYHRCVCPICN